MPSTSASTSAGARGALPVDPLAAMFRRGLDLHREGKLQDAGLTYQQVLAANPRHAEASHSLGMVHHQLGNAAQAERLITKALELAPGNPVFLSNLGLVQLALQRPADAVDSYRKALRLDPDAALLHAQLAVALLALGRAADAAQSALRALRLRPNYAVALAHLGRAQGALGRRREAEASFAAAIAAQPALLDAYLGWGDLLAPDDLAGAAGHYRQAIALRPEHAGAHLALAGVLSRLGQHQAAADNYRGAAFVAPSVAAYLGLAGELDSLGRHDEAVEAGRLAHRIADDAAGREAASALLDRLGAAPVAGERALSDLEREVEQKRIAVDATPGNPVALANLGAALNELGRLDEGVDHLRRAISLKPDYFSVWSNYLFAINYLGDLPVPEMVAEARRYGELVAAQVPARLQHANLADPVRRLKVGFVSGDLHAHPVGRFIEAVVGSLDSATVELFVYHSAVLVDDLTERLMRLVPNWRAVDAMSDDDLAAQIGRDGIDILVDLSGHTAQNRLLVFARKPAPVAVTWIGYFATTGLEAIDYVLATRHVIPPDEAGQWVEKPWRLPETYLCFTPPRLHVPLAPPPALANGYVTFGSANNILKLNDRTAACWAEVLHAVPDSRLRLRSRPLGDRAVAEKIVARFGALGIPADRLLLEGAQNDYGRHLACYNDVDIALDPFPYAGGTTTVEALWMGVPVLTLKGDRYVSHMGENILHNVGLPDWIAADTTDYVARAAAFAANPQALARMRHNLRHDLLVSPLCDAPRFARNLEQAFRGMWQKWCADT